MKRVSAAASVVLGDAVRWKGGTYLVAALQGHSVYLLSQSPQGEDATILVDALLQEPDFTLLNGQNADGQRPGPAPCRQDGATADALASLALLEGLPQKAQEQVAFWLGHVLEVHTGLPRHAGPGATPRTCYDPALTTLRERYATKAAELQAAHHKVSAATVERKRLAWLSQGVWGLVDKRHLRPVGSHGRVDERVIQLLRKVHKRMHDKPAGTGSRLFELLRRACVKKFNKTEAERLMPSRATFYRLLDRLGIRWGPDSGSRGGNSADTYQPAPPFTPTIATTPGEQVQIDTTALRVRALDESGHVVSVELTAAIDVATRTILAAVIRPKSSGTKTKPHSRRHGGRATKAVDALLLLADMCTPQPMRPGWSKQARAEGSGLPYEELVETDERMRHAAARPVIVPDMIVMDNGKVFAGRAFMDACAHLGISVRPACYHSPTHKAIIERTFRSVKSLFSQFVAGYTGPGLAARTRGADGTPLWTLEQLNSILQEWIAVGWQQRPHAELRNPFMPSMPPRTPNQMFAAHVASSGYVPVRLGAEDRLKLLPTAWVQVTEHGIRLNNRTYDSAALKGYRGALSGWPGKGRRWPVRYHPHQPEKVWLQDHRGGSFIEAGFIHQRLIGDLWTEQVWDRALAAHLEQGGSPKQESAVARAVRRLLERAGRGPSRSQPEVGSTPERGVRVGPELVADPYAGIPRPDFDSITAPPSMDTDPRRLHQTPPRTAES
ncbi:Mu transposase C-terminal domain-containing protein [Streptomyces erythrochromogenes]|uniref:Mu transposase C-terminal domain-containing protein n=1 Tax=Streptomyces erythrochromogenes TaxID=285574 RepID=UPI0036FC1EE7